MSTQSAETVDPSWPEQIGTEDDLDRLLSRPSRSLVAAIRDFRSPLVIIGAGGKMGPTLACMARRAAAEAGCTLEVVAVSRLTNDRTRTWLEQRGITTVSCDLLEVPNLDCLPGSDNVIFMAGQKFGTDKSPADTWAVNVLSAARVAQRYASARLVALSTANVYPPSKVAQRGSVESDPLTPVGEYANSAVGRERVLEFCSQRAGTPLALIRLCYAVELRYGVLVDLAQKVHTGGPVELANGFFNCIWQGDANDLILRALALARRPAAAWNLCRPEVFSVRAVATRLGELLGRAPRFVGAENPDALLCDSRPLCAALGEPATPLDPMLRWISAWVKSGGRTLGKPTHFEVRDGRY